MEVASKGCQIKTRRLAPNWVSVALGNVNLLFLNTLLVWAFWIAQSNFYISWKGPFCVLHVALYVFSAGELHYMCSFILFSCRGDWGCRFFRSCPDVMDVALLIFFFSLPNRGPLFGRAPTKYLEDQLPRKRGPSGCGLGRPEYLAPSWFLFTWFQPALQSYIKK